MEFKILNNLYQWKQAARTAATIPGIEGRITYGIDYLVQLVDDQQFASAWRAKQSVSSGGISGASAARLE